MQETIPQPPERTANVRRAGRRDRPHRAGPRWPPDAPGPPGADPRGCRGRGSARPRGGSNGDTFDVTEVWLTSQGITLADAARRLTVVEVRPNARRTRLAGMARGPVRPGAPNCMSSEARQGTPAKPAGRRRSARVFPTELVGNPELAARDEQAIAGDANDQALPLQLR